MHMHNNYIYNLSINVFFLFSEKLFMRTADLLVSEGYAKLGYQYVIVDDCWLAKNRSADGNLQADKNRFPSGIKALSDYVSVSFKYRIMFIIKYNPKYFLLDFYADT